MSYSSVTITSNTDFTWDYPYTGGVVISDVNDLDVQDAGLIAVMPPAKGAVLGNIIIFNNIGAFAIDIVKYGSQELIATIESQSVVNLYITEQIDNAGEWRAIQMTGGSLGITSLKITSSDATLNITGSPVSAGASGNITIGTNDVLETISALNSSGILVSTKDDTSNVTTRSLVAGDNINITNPNGSSGNIAIALTDSISNITSIDVGNLTLSDSTITTTDSSALSLNGLSIDTNSNVTIAGNLNVTGAFPNPQIIKSWVLFNNVITTDSNVLSILAQLGVISVVQANGYYTITFTTPFTDINYGVLISLGSYGVPPNISVRHGFVIAKQQTNVVIAIVDASGQLVTDAPNGITVSILGL